LINCVSRTFGCAATSQTRKPTPADSKRCCARAERIDQLTAQVDQLRQHSRHADEAAEHMATFVGLMHSLEIVTAQEVAA
jgi:hypothetical protein